MLLTPKQLMELINHIEVCHANKVDGTWQHMLVIHYNRFGSLELPETVALPPPDISIYTRKGAFVSCAGQESYPNKKSAPAGYSDPIRTLVLVPVVGLEPTRYRYQRILSPLRLPFRHTGECVEIIGFSTLCVK